MDFSLAHCAVERGKGLRGNILKVRKAENIRKNCYKGRLSGSTERNYETMTFNDVRIKLYSKFRKQGYVSMESSFEMFSVDIRLR